MTYSWANGSRGDDAANAGLVERMVISASANEIVERIIPSNSDAVGPEND
jgi:hypothetical protein